MSQINPDHHHDEEQGEALDAQVVRLPVPPQTPPEPESGDDVDVVRGVVVDDPKVTGEREGWLATRRAYLDEAPAVIPSYLRNRAEFSDNARLTTRYYLHKSGFHAARTPVYAMRLWRRAPRGAARLTRQWWLWVTDAEARPVVAAAAAKGDPGAWVSLHSVQTKRTRPRQKQSIIVAVPAVLLLTLAAVLLPTWALATAAAGVASLLGLAGRDPDAPIINRYVSIQLMRPLSSPEVEAALAAIGVKGRVDWPTSIAIDGPGWRAEIDLPGGTTADAVLEKRALLAGAMRRPLTTVWPSTDPDAHPARLVLWVAKQDPAKAPRRLWPLLKNGQANLFEAIPFGFDPRGRLVELSLMGTNMLIGGVPGSGKTSAVMAIAAAGALDVSCEMWLYEMKGSGDLDGLRPICHRYVSGDDDEECEAALDALKALEKELKRRKAIIKALPITDVPEGRKVYPHLAARTDLRLHPLLAIFDEAHTLFEHKDYGKKAAEIAARLIRKARAYGIIIIFTTQRPDSNSIPKSVSDNAALRFCLAVVGQPANDMILGTSAYQNGVRATMFDPKKEAGTGWLSRSAHDNQIVRAAFITQQESAEIGRRALALRTAAGTLSGQAAGETIEPVDATDLIDHLHTIWPTGEDRMHSHRLVEALAAYRPDLYGAWTKTNKPTEAMTEEELREVRAARSTTLAGALKPFGVGTRQINKRGDGGGGKGLHYADLPDRNDPQDALEEDEEED